VARIDDGELYLEIEGATEAQLSEGLAVARRYIERAGAFVDDVLQSAGRRNAAMDEGLIGVAELTDDDLDRADLVNEATLEALKAASARSGTLGLLPIKERTRNRPVVRDLFEVFV
jgi:hypothetical protein